MGRYLSGAFHSNKLLVLIWGMVVTVLLISSEIFNNVNGFDFTNLMEMGIAWLFMIMTAMSF